jgi:hypothetical protein
MSLKTLLAEAACITDVQLHFCFFVKMIKYTSFCLLFVYKIIHQVQF